MIKYEGCFKNGDSDCFVLEHVEHDRPEVNSIALQFYSLMLPLSFYAQYVFLGFATGTEEGGKHFSASMVWLLHVQGSCKSP